MRILLLAISLIIGGCETTKLWQADPQDEYVKIIPERSDEDVEAALKTSGREYHCQVLFQSIYPNDKVCYAKLTAADKRENIRIKLLKTPETLAIDAGHAVEVIGYVMLNVIMHSGYHN